MTAITLSCEVCGAPTGDDPHFPHDPECSGVLDPDCYCAALTCARCCWDDECKTSEPQITGGDSDRGSGGRDTAAAAQSVDGAPCPLGAGSTAGGADAVHDAAHASAVGDIR